MKLDICNKCQKTGRSKNLFNHNGKMLCPTCTPLGMMHWSYVKGEKVVIIMDFEKAAVVQVPMSNMGEYQSYIGECCTGKVNNPAYEQKG